MKEESVLRGILLVISLYEVWLYYQLVFGVLIERKYLQKRQMLILWLSIVIIGVSLAVNRKLLFFSDTVFFYTLALLMFFSCLIIKKKTFLIVGIVLGGGEAVGDNKGGAAG